MNGNNILIVVLLQATSTIQQKQFNFPSEIQALIGSCVEIPCTVNISATGPKNTDVVWHIARANRGYRIIYSTNPYEISTIYKNRASLIGNPEDSCTLRILKVAKTDEKGYYPADKKLPFSRSAPENVQLRVTDVPPQPELSLPEEIVEGTPTLIICSVEYTCPTSRPTLNWDFPGLPVKENKKDNGKGNWLATSELTYEPSGEHNGSNINCIARFPNGQTSQTSAMLNIVKVEQKLDRNITPIIIAVCLISLLLVVPLFIWRFLLGKKISRSCNQCKINDSFKSKDPKGTVYTDLLEREKTRYYSLKPATQGEAHLKPPENRTTYSNIYEEMLPSVK